MAIGVFSRAVFPPKGVNMKKTLKIMSLAVLIAVAATVISSFIPIGSVEAHQNFPDNVWDWDDEDWDKFIRVYQAPVDVWYDGVHYLNIGDNWWYIASDGEPYPCERPRASYDENYNLNGSYYNYYNNNSNYHNSFYGTNFYGGVLNIYDGASEYQAQVLAKIINLYAHGVASQTQQACVGWTVMNSVDASPGNDIGSIAPLFHYDASRPTVDDFGRDLMPLARDIVYRWKAGRSGVQNNGRVLPQGYIYVWSTGNAVAFRTTGNESTPAWGYSLASPYGN